MRIYNCYMHVHLETLTMHALFYATFVLLVSYAVGQSICLPPEWEARSNLLGGISYSDGGKMVSLLQSVSNILALFV